MKGLIAMLALLMPIIATADVVDDAAKGITDNIVMPLAEQLQKRTLRSLANGQGPMADAAKKDLKQRDLAEKEETRGVRRTVKECIKPGNVIDDDVQECVRGYRAKSW